jgi:hypothetical protein
MQPVPSFQAGTELTTAFLHGLVEAVRELQTLAIQHAAPPLERSLGTLFCHVPPVIQVIVHNASGSARVAYDVLGIDDATIAPGDDLEGFQDSPIQVEGVTPAVASHVGRCVVLLEDIAIDGTGRGILSGPTAAWINVTNEDCASNVDVADGVTDYLQAGNVGYGRVDWRAGGTGTQWAIVTLGTTAGRVQGPYSMLPADRNTEAAQTDTWDRDNLNGTTQAGTIGVIYPGPRVVYVAAGMYMTVWEFYRIVTYDSAGRVATISAETQRAIDVPGVCP